MPETWHASAQQRQMDTNVCQANFGLRAIAWIQSLYMDMAQTNGCTMPFAGCLASELQSNTHVSTIAVAMQNAKRTQCSIGIRQSEEVWQVCFKACQLCCTNLRPQKAQQGALTVLTNRYCCRSPFHAENSSVMSPINGVYS